MQETIKFSSGTVNYYFESAFDEIWNMYDRRHTVLVTNEHVARLYPHLFEGHKTLIVAAMESSKSLHTVEGLIKQLIELEATRKTVLIGVGGGVVTDLTGFLASIYMRGVDFGFVPTTLLAMVDASVGGKNGVNMGYNKNLLGTITQPKFILYDTRFLDTLPDDEWSNGFAEIIKYACIFDAPLFDVLNNKSISHYRDHDDGALQELIRRCVAWKNKTVAEDEKETGVRKLLNFGHTAAHAIENLYEIPHGKAVGIGMVIACRVSSQVAGLEYKAVDELERILGKYHLPASMKINAKRAMEILRMDKKRDENNIDYIVLEQIGKAKVQSLPITAIEKAMKDYESDN